MDHRFPTTRSIVILRALASAPLTSAPQRSHSVAARKPFCWRPQTSLFSHALGRILSLVLLLSTACTTLEVRRYAPDEIPPAGPTGQIIGATTDTGREIPFDSARIEENAIVGLVQGQQVRVDLAEAQAVWIRESHIATGRTILLGTGIGFAVLLALTVITNDFTK